MIIEYQTRKRLKPRRGDMNGHEHTVSIIWNYYFKNNTNNN